MKLFLKRDGDGFVVLDKNANVRYTVSLMTERTSQKLVIETPERKVVSVISNKNMMLRYFSVKCNKHLYVLVPYMGECFAFVIYGSTYRFAGNMAEGRFSMYDVDKSPVMTQKQCWGCMGDGYELNIYVNEQEYFALSVAICAALYLSCRGENPVPT